MISRHSRARTKAWLRSAAHPLHPVGARRQRHRRPCGMGRAAILREQSLRAGVLSQPDLQCPQFRDRSAANVESAAAVSTGRRRIVVRALHQMKLLLEIADVRDRRTEMRE